ncbi:hypothetical protein [Candidatus Oscillochloris fontis]|uniref:hypothetical protein n=1 Tax=Candidatus Oscillochloris fontis TaxID=2496868 RepID=UPI001375B260|nr:hypothetical protein [Candidatus Oscillochloris fontis]
MALQIHPQTTQIDYVRAPWYLRLRWWLVARCWTLSHTYTESGIEMPDLVNPLWRR